MSAAQPIPEPGQFLLESLEEARRALARWESARREAEDAATRHTYVALTVEAELERRWVDYQDACRAVHLAVRRCLERDVASICGLREDA